MTTVSWKVTKQFFDKKAVTKRVDKATAKVLNRAGARVRKIMRFSLRRSKKKSLPGQPPRIHKKGPGLKTILYAYNPIEKNVVIGPVGWPGSNVPKTLEFGGQLTVRKKIRRRGRNKIVKSKATLAARPFAGPAEATYRDTYASDWSQSV